MTIYGTRLIKKVKAQLRLSCHECPSQEVNICLGRQWATLFFVPIFPMSGKDFFIQCPRCAACYAINDGIDMASILEEHAKKHESEK